MADLEAVVPAEEPVSTESIVANATAGLNDAADDAEETVADTVATAPDQLAQPDPHSADTGSVVDPDFGISPRNLQGRENRLPYSRLRAILDRAKTGHAAELATSAARIAEFEKQQTGYQQQVDAMRIAEENPDVFLKALAEADPRYAKLLAREAREEQQEQPAQSAAQKPQPDILLPDGSLSYSAEGFERLADWKAEQREKALDARYSERFGGMEKDYKVQQHINAAIPRVQAQITDAQTWPLFKENQEEITAALTADRSLSLDGAYRKVVLPKLGNNRDSMRKELLAEINRKPAAASRAIPGGAAPVNDGPQTTEDIVRSAVASLKT